MGKTATLEYHRTYNASEKGRAAAKRYRESEKGQTAYLNGWYRRGFGITLAEYDKLYEEQSGVCAICREPETTLSRTGGTVRRLAVDHDHKTGRVRGLLCHRCNVFLERLEQDGWLRGAQQYLARSADGQSV